MELAVGEWRSVFRKLSESRFQDILSTCVVPEANDMQNLVSDFELGKNQTYASLGNKK